MNLHTLQQTQSALLNALVAWPRQSDAQVAQSLPIVQHPLAARGLNAYRANVHAGAHSALGTAFPVMAQLLGDEAFEMLSLAFWHRHPPARGDWALWGEALAHFIVSEPQLQGEPYLPDVARLEWQLHQLASAPDDAADATSLQALLSHEPDQLHLQLAAHTPCWRSPYPVVSLVLAHVVPEPDLTEAGQMLRAGVGQTVLVWRQHFKPCVREALTGEATFLAALQAGCSLTDAMDQSPDLNFEQWLATAVQTRLLLAVIPHPPPVLNP